MPLSGVGVTFRRSRLPLRAAAIVVGAIACSAMSACSPYVYSDEIQTFSNKVKSIDSTYQDSKQKIADEERLTQRAKWIVDKPKLAAGPGCDSIAKSSVRCLIVPQSSGEPARQPARQPANATFSEVDTTRPVTPSTRTVTSKDVCEATASTTGEPKTDAGEKKEVAGDKREIAGIEEKRALLLKSLVDYAAGLAAVTKAQDRADFDSAAAKLSTAVGTMAGPYASAAKASSNAVLWIVGQDLDYRRIEALRIATRIACKPIHDVAKTLGQTLTGQRDKRVLGLQDLLDSREKAAETARSKPGITGPTFGAAIDDMQAAAVTLETVRATDPDAAVQALSDAHDALVVAVRNNDGQFDALVTSMQTFAQRANDLAAAAAATASTTKS